MMGESRNKVAVPEGAVWISLQQGGKLTLMLNPMLW